MQFSAFTAATRVYTHTAESCSRCCIHCATRAHTLTHTRARKLRCTYVQRARSMCDSRAHAHATGSRCLSRSSFCLLIFPLFFSSYSIYLLFLFLSRSCSCIYSHTRTRARARVAFLSPLCRSTSLSFSVGVCVHIARARYIYIYTLEVHSAHTRPRRVHAGVGHVRAALFALARQPSSFICPESELYALFSDLPRDELFGYTRR